MNKIIIQEYDPNWQNLFEQEKEQLLMILPVETTIQHIGSTSVPGLSAKPIIDIVIGVVSLEIADLFYIDPITKLGYIYVAEYEQQIPERRYFRKINNPISYHIHIVVHNGNLWGKYINFRDYLVNILK